MDFKVGDRVRIKSTYPFGTALFVPINVPGTEFTVTRVVPSPKPYTREPGAYVSGDPAGFGIWTEYLEKVEEEPQVSAETAPRIVVGNWGGLKPSKPAERPEVYEPLKVGDRVHFTHGFGLDEEFDATITEVKNDGAYRIKRDSGTMGLAFEKEPERI